MVSGRCRRSGAPTHPGAFTPSVTCTFKWSNGGSTSGDQELSLAMALLAELVQDGDEEKNEDHGEDDDKKDHVEDDDTKVLNFFHGH